MRYYPIAASVKGRQARCQRMRRLRPDQTRSQRARELAIERRAIRALPGARA